MNLGFSEMAFLVVLGLLLFGPKKLPEIGRQIGKLPYDRMRDLEFSSKGLPKADLRARLAELNDVIPSAVSELSSEQMLSEYPEVVLEKPLSTQEFLIHLYGHLNWHLGQVDYLRRALSGNGAIERAGL